MSCTTARNVMSSRTSSPRGTQAARYGQRHSHAAMIAAVSTIGT